MKYIAYNLAIFMAIITPVYSQEQAEREAGNYTAITKDGQIISIEKETADLWLRKGTTTFERIGNTGVATQGCGFTVIEEIAIADNKPTGNVRYVDTVALVHFNRQQSLSKVGDEDETGLSFSQPTYDPRTPDNVGSGSG